MNTLETRKASEFVLFSLLELLGSQRKCFCECQQLALLSVVLSTGPYKVLKEQNEKQNKPILPHLTAVQLQPTSHRHLDYHCESSVLVLPRHRPVHGSFNTRPPHSSEPPSPGDAGETQGSEGDQEPHSPSSQDNPILIPAAGILQTSGSVVIAKAQEEPSLPSHQRAQDPPDSSMGASAFGAAQGTHTPLRAASWAIS